MLFWTRGHTETPLPCFRVKISKSFKQCWTLHMETNTPYDLWPGGKSMVLRVKFLKRWWFWWAHLAPPRLVGGERDAPRGPSPSQRAGTRALRGGSTSGCRRGPAAAAQSRWARPWNPSSCLRRQRKRRKHLLLWANRMTAHGNLDLFYRASRWRIGSEVKHLPQGTAAWAVLSHEKAADAFRQSAEYQRLQLHYIPTANISTGSLYCC